MKQLLYVYVPGFEYDSKGPLHIDAIRLDVTIGDVEKDEVGNILNSLKTYIYIPPVNKKGKYDPENTLIEGNIIYRTSASHVWHPESNESSGRFNNTYDSAYNPFWTEKTKTKIISGQEIKQICHDRVLHGFFYDFITTPKESEKTHHVIGIHNTPGECQTNVSNLDIREHDGLFAILIEELNTELVLNFTFYSRITPSTIDSDYIKVGEQEILQRGIPGSMFYNTDFFTQEKITKEKFGKNFFDEYIEIGKWLQSYNPATSGIEQGTILTSALRNLYFDLETWGTEDHSWEIPVNAGMLVSDMSNLSYLKPISGSKPIWKQFKYDNNKNSLTYRHHICDDSLVCNSTSYPNYGGFYTNFYQGGITPIPAGQGTSAKYKGKAIFANRNTWVALGDSLFNLCQATSCYNITSNKKETATYEYQLSNADLSNLSYLYKDPISVTINNLAHNSLVGNTSDLDLVVVSLDHCGRLAATTNFLFGVLDMYNFNDIQDNGDGYNYYYKSDFTIPPVNLEITLHQKLPGDTKKEIALSENAMSMYYERVRAESYNNKTIDIYLKNYYNNRPNPYITPNGFKSSYLVTIQELAANSLYHTIAESLLNTGETQVTIKNDSTIELSVDVSSVSFPVTAYDSEVHSRVAQYLGWKMDRDFNKKVPWTTAYVTSLKNRGVGAVTVFIPLMFQINLDPDKTKISKQNLADHKIIPMLYIDENGYSKGEQIPVNITPVNLLDPLPNSQDPLPNSLEDGGYELQRVLSNSTSIKTTTELLYKDTSGPSTKTKYDSSFCNEKRFLDKSTTSIQIEREVALTEGLYILKILNMYPKEDTGITIDYSFGNTRENNVSGYYNKWAFLVKTAGTFKLHNIKRAEASWKNSDNTYDIISGIGLYQVDLSKLDTNTLILNNTVVDLNINGFLSPRTSDYLSIYNLIIFPAAFCALENIHFCSRLDSYTRPSSYKSDYENDYCVNITDDPIYHYYNFKYLPSKAVYDVYAYYTIPSGDELRIDPELILLVTNLFDIGKLSFLRSQIVRL